MIDVPDTINAVGLAAAGVLTAWQTRTARKVRDLELRLAIVEKERDDIRKLFRQAVRHIREWMAWAMHHAPGVPPPDMPKDLRDEV